MYFICFRCCRCRSRDHHQHTNRFIFYVVVSLSRFSSFYVANTLRPVPRAFCTILPFIIYCMETQIQIVSFHKTGKMLFHHHSVNMGKSGQREGLFHFYINMNSFCGSLNNMMWWTIHLNVNREKGEWRKNNNNQSFGKEGMKTSEW